jgi:uncharacterized repeat protein (TIGR02543 family)
LTSITIPSTVTFIDAGAFKSTAKLQKVTFAPGSQLTGIVGFQDATALTSITIPSSVTSIGNLAFFGATELTSINIPESVTAIGSSAFGNAFSLKDIYFFGNAPYVADYAFSTIARMPKAHIKFGSTGYAGKNQIWNELTIVDDLHTVTYSAAGGTAVNQGSFTTGGTIQSAPVSTRDGYTLAGWSETATGSVVNFPYNPTATTDITLHAIWTLKPVKATYASSVKLTGKTKVGQTITVSPGKWNGTAPITYKYQWYVCTAASTKVLTTGKVAPKCTLIKGATKASFKATTKQKGGYLSVLITGTNLPGTSSIFTATSAKVT